MEEGINNVLVIPNSSKRAISFDVKKRIHVVNLKSSAENNKANEELVSFLSKKFNCEIKILKGKTQRKKLVLLKFF